MALTDGPLLAEFFARLSPEDLRFRFLDTRKVPRVADITFMLDIDSRHGEHLLAFDTGTGQLAGTLMLIADTGLDTAEVAIAVASEWKGKGIGWALLRHASDLAFIRGIRTLQCIESRSNHGALEAERALGFHARDISGEPELVLLEAQFG